MLRSTTSAWAPTTRNWARKRPLKTLCTACSRWTSTTAIHGLRASPQFSNLLCRSSSRRSRVSRRRCPRRFYSRTSTQVRPIPGSGPGPGPTRVDRVGGPRARQGEERWLVFLCIGAAPYFLFFRRMLPLASATPQCPLQATEGWRCSCTTYFPRCHTTTMPRTLAPPTLPFLLPMVFTRSLPLAYGLDTLLACCVHSLLDAASLLGRRGAVLPPISF